MGKTSIEWTDETWNPVLGCRRKSPGCLHCYAERLIATRMSKNPKLSMYRDIARLTERGEPQFTGAHRLVASRLEEPLRARKGRRYFVCDMGDLFFEGHPFEEIAAVFGVMAAAPQHTFQVLTKRPERMVAFFAWLEQECMHDGARTNGTLWTPRALRCGVEAANRGADVDYLGLPDAWPLPNVWVGTSVENQETADARIPQLLQIPARTRFLSLEPLLERVDVAPWLCPHAVNEHGDCAWWCRACRIRRAHAVPLDGTIGWMIIGGESGPHARPCDLAWIRDLRDEGRAAGVAVFVKQLGARPVFNGLPLMRGEYEAGNHRAPGLAHPKGGDLSEWPADLRVREIPSVAPVAPSLSSAVEEVFGP